VFRAAPEVGPIPFAALLAAALPLFSCAPPAAEPDASVPEGPTITSIEPADGATNVATNPVVRVGVSDHLDDWTVNSGAFKLYSGPLSYWLMAYYDPVGRCAVVWPAAALREGAHWVVETSEGITGRDGGPLAAGVVAGFTTGAEKGDDAPFEELEYEADIRPIFASRCSSCHGGDGPVAGLALDTADGVVETALGAPSTGDVALDRVVPGRPGRSFLVYKIIEDDTGSIDRMPRSFDGDEPAVPLSLAEQQAISDWIAAGAAIGP
jgi:hypothetical protein